MSTQEACINASDEHSSPDENATAARSTDETIEQHIVFHYHAATHQLMKVEEIDRNTGERKEINMNDHCKQGYDPYGSYDPYGGAYDPHSAGYDPYGSSYDPYGTNYSAYDSYDASYDPCGYGASDPYGAGYDPYGGAYAYTRYSVSPGFTLDTCHRCCGHGFTAGNSRPWSTHGTPCFGRRTAIYKTVLIDAPPDIAIH